MKLRSLIQTYFSKTDHSVERTVDFTKMEQDILTALPVQTNHMKRTIFVSLMAVFIFLGIIAGIYTFTKPGTVALAPAVSAADLIDKVQKTLGKQFSYTQKTTQFCSTNEKDYAESFKNESGDYEDNPETRAMIEECRRNNGKLFYTSSVWVDQSKNLVRTDEVIPQWQIQAYPDKQGRKRMATFNPTNIKQGDSIYSFHVLEGTKTGLYTKKPKSDWMNDQLKSKMKSPEEVITESLQKYKDGGNFKVSFSEVPLDGRQVYKLTFASPQVTQFEDRHPEFNGEYKTYYEDYFEKETYRPLKKIYYDAQGKPFSETVYENFSNSVDEKIFNISVPPSGYSFLKGTVSAFDISSYCPTCQYGKPIEYRIIPLQILDENGKELDIPGLGDGEIMMPYKIKVYESKERFVNAAQVKAASDITYQELEQFEPEYQYEALNDSYFYSNANIGTDKPYSKLKIEILNSNGRPQRATEQIVSTHYSSKKMSSLGDLVFMHHEINDQNVQIANYSWKNKSDIIVEFQTPVLAEDMCNGFRDPTTCTVTTTGEISEARIKQKEIWRIDLKYKQTFVTIQFNGKTSDSEKEEVVDKAKELIKKVNNEWQ